VIYGLCDRTRIEATPKGRADCPTCGGELRAKCGRIVAWHWAHVAKDCDPWSEGESAWHLGWKMLAHPQDREVIIGPHRADLVSLRGTVVELQHSSISTDEIEERERFYGDMVWVVDAAPFADNLDLRERNGGEYLSFRWRHPRKTLLAIRKPLFFDLGGGDLLEICNVWPDCPVGGWGYRRSQAWFFSRFMGFNSGSEGRAPEDWLRWRLRETHADCSVCGVLTPKSPDTQYRAGGKTTWGCAACPYPCSICKKPIGGGRGGYGAGEDYDSICRSCWYAIASRRVA
jgi:competence protein CoiA